MLLSELTNNQLNRLITFLGENTALTDTEIEKCIAYGIHADYSISDLKDIKIDGDIITDGGQQYCVLTDSEADEEAKGYILNTLWAFNPSFLASETGVPQVMFEALQNNGRCEGNNDAILACIKDDDTFCKAAIQADGRGCFLSSYNGIEHEERVNGFEYYIYRIN